MDVGEELWTVCRESSQNVRIIEAHQSKRGRETAFVDILVVLISTIKRLVGRGIRSAGVNAHSVLGMMMEMM